jgi:hypothetical protein
VSGSGPRGRAGSLAAGRPPLTYSDLPPATEKGLPAKGTQHTRRNGGRARVLTERFKGGTRMRVYAVDL